MVYNAVVIILLAILYLTIRLLTETEVPKITILSKIPRLPIFGNLL